jgi:hypothetical protein
VREDFLDEKKALDEVVPYIFGIPQMVERDSFSIPWSVAPAESIIEDDSMAMRMFNMRLFFGCEPSCSEDAVPASLKELSKHERFVASVVRQKVLQQYEPTLSDLTGEKFVSMIHTNLDFLRLKELSSGFGYGSLNISSYFRDCSGLQSKMFLDSVPDRNILVSAHLEFLINKYPQVTDKMYMRQLYFAYIKRVFNKTNIPTVPITLYAFEGLIEEWESKCSQLSATTENIFVDGIDETWSRNRKYSMERLDVTKDVHALLLKLHNAMYSADCIDDINGNSMPTERETIQEIPAPSLSSSFKSCILL